MNNIFRPVEFWKSAVMTMPDSSFFELLRSVFGKIKTPFNKQHLIKNLETFLLREDIQKTITAYIDENDAKIIAAIAVFGEPVPGELESFFSGEFSFVQLHDIIVNLEERFILYRFKEDNKSRLALNPVLEQVLSPIAADISQLFPAVNRKVISTVPCSTSAIINDRILSGLLSFVSQWDLFYRGEGIIRRHIIETGKVCFPGIDLEQTLGALQALGLFYVNEYRLVPDKKHFYDLGLLSARERMEYCTAALLMYNEIKPSAEILQPLYKSRIREIANFMHSLLDSLDVELLYTEKTLNRLMEILKTRTGTSVNNGILLEAMEKTGLIISTSPEIKQAVSFTQDKVNNTPVAIDSDFSVHVYPEISYTDAISLASFLAIKETGTIVRFKLEKDSAVRAFDNNVSTDEIIDLLNRLSGGRVEESLIWNLKEWEKRYKEVSLKEGVILTLSQDRQYLAQTAPLASMINETLAQGVYLLSRNTAAEAAAALHGAGIDIVAHCSSLPDKNEKPKVFTSTNSYFPVLSPHILLEKIPASVSPAPKKDFNAITLTEEFYSILKKMKLDTTEYAELSARINRRLVLCEAQLKDAHIRYEKLEARNMDYAGKQNIARQAIAQQSPVEIIQGVNKNKSLFGIPKALEKDNGELVFVIIPEGKDDELRIPLAKISLLRKIKKSIFET